MWSKYHPLLKQIKGEVFDFLSARLEASLIAFSLGLLWGFFVDTSLGYIGIAIGGCICFFLNQSHLKRSFFFLILTFFCLGVGCVQARLQWVKHRVLSEPVFQITLSGEVEENLSLPEKQILTLKNFQSLPPQLGDIQKVQLTYPNQEPILKSGDKLVSEVNLFPLNGIENIYQSRTPSLLYFSGFSARGEILKIRHYISGKKVSSFWEKIRKKMAHHLFQILPEKQARIATPLILGEQRFVAPDQYRLYRQAGIVHVLSVSGFHMALLAGFLFFLIRGICACISYLTLYFNSKKIAAVLAWIGTLFYLILSGCQIPALRSFGMISLVFLGILLDRPAFSKRSLFLIAFVLLIYQPENILSISFQLSFLSVLVLITTHEGTQRKMKDKNLFLTSCVEFFLLNLTITLALMPVIAWHFNLINPYGVVGNLFLSTLFSFFIMPCLFLGSVFMPLNLGDCFFLWAGSILSWIEAFCVKIIQLPWAEVPISVYVPQALIGFIFALIFFCTYRLMGKVIGAILLLLSLIFIFYTPTPQMLIHKNSYAWIQGGKFYQNSEASQFLISRWQRRLGYARVESIPLPNFVVIKGQKIAFKGVGCPGAQIALLAYPDSRCLAPTLIMNPNDLYQIFISPNKIIIHQGDKIIRTIKS